MIDKEQFDSTYQHVDNETTIAIIDIFVSQRIELLTTLEHNIANHDLVQVKLNAHKLKGSLGQLYGIISWEQAGRMEDMAFQRILEILDFVIVDYPDSFKTMRQELDDYNFFSKKLVPAHNLTAFFTGFLDLLSPEYIMKLEDLEKSKMADDFSELLSDLNTSSSEFLEDLTAIKKNLFPDLLNKSFIFLLKLTKSDISDGNNGKSKNRYILIRIPGG